VQGMELEFVFMPTTGAADGSWPPRRHHQHRQWQNPNRQGTPLAFWRSVKDGLRHLTGGTYRGAYTAPGPHGRPNNIVPERLPGRGRDLPGSGRDGIGQLATRQPHLEVPALPPFSLPGHLEQLPITPRQLSLATRQSTHTIFRNQPLSPDKPISYRQELLFVGDTDRFVNRATAQWVMSTLLTLMQQHPTVHVTIMGNAATDFEAKGYQYPYGRNKTRLMKFPAWGIYNGKAYYGTEFRTIGDLMLARARAIGNLLTSKGIEASRVHCSVGRLEYGDGSAASGARKRRATIIISERP
jgi:outer membrane protein OmpA-like peptidoglycan-associated protein